MENQEQEQQVASQPELSITDLQNLRAIVDTAIRRGTFSGSEISSVGAVYDRVNSFINAVSAQEGGNLPAVGQTV
jgi:hypothetical protein